MSSFSKSANSCSEDEAHDLRRGPWTLEEDTLLIHYIARHGEGRWNLLAKRAGLRRNGKSCRLRWLNYLKPDVKRGNLTPQEQLLILELHSKWGNRWSKIAQHLPGRTDNEIKNYWRTRVQKQARHLKIDANSTAFRDVIRCFWMPRLLQKIEGSSSSSSSSSMLSQNSISAVPQNLDHAASQHYSASSKLSSPQVPAAEHVMQSLDHHDHNSDSEHCTSSVSGISSSESMNFSQISQFSSEYPASNHFPVISNTDYSTLARDCYFDDNSCYAMEPINLAATSSLLGDFGNPLANAQMEENNWVHDGFADGLWNMEELWEIRNLHERRI